MTRATGQAVPRRDARRCRGRAGASRGDGAAPPSDPQPRGADAAARTRPSSPMRCGAQRGSAMRRRTQLLEALRRAAGGRPALPSRFPSAQHPRRRRTMRWSSTGSMPPRAIPRPMFAARVVLLDAASCRNSPRPISMPISPASIGRRDDPRLAAGHRRRAPRRRRAGGGFSACRSPRRSSAISRSRATSRSRSAVRPLYAS